MADITAQLVRDLRAKTGAGMMDCKKALGATEGDFEAAIDHLRKQGLQTAGKKAGRTTSEGRVFALASDDNQTGSMVAVACETDFVARTPDFEGFLGELASHVIELDTQGRISAESLEGQPWVGDGATVGDAVKTTIGKLGENIQVSEAGRYQSSAGFVFSYVHHDQKKGAIVSVTTDSDFSAAQETLKDLCMHIVVYDPDGVNREEVPAELVERERAIHVEAVAGKPEEIQEKIITGKLERFFAERVLTEQPWVKEPKMTVQKALEKALGAGARIEAMSRFEVGA